MTFNLFSVIAYQKHFSHRSSSIEETSKMRASKFFLTLLVIVFAVYNICTICVTALNVSKQKFTALELVIENLRWMTEIICSIFLVFGALKSKVSFLYSALVFFVFKGFVTVWKLQKLYHQAIKCEIFFEDNECKDDKVLFLTIVVDFGESFRQLVEFQL